MTTDMTIEKFLRKLRNLEGMYRRLDSGQLTGRNSESSDAGRLAAYKTLDEMIRADAATDDAPLCEYLDSHPKTNERWNKIERRTYGLPI